MSASVCLYQRSSPDNQNDPEAFSSDYQVWIYKEHRSYSAMECFLGGRRVARKILNVALFLISTQENLKSSSFILPLILMALPLRPSFLAFGYGVSPILRELTDSVSTDSIQTSSCLTFIVHLLTHRYELTQDSSVVFANARLSLCAALFGSVCLASRLQSSYEAFLLLSVAVLIFVLIPLIEVELIQDFVAFCILSLVIPYKFTAYPYKITSLLILLLFVSFVCPILYVRWQMYKSVMSGPWDEAVPHLDKRQVVDKSL
uniref:AGAP005923PAlike [Tribolium castaneum] n=1 Tax=Lepeophtheirus salmonis TaxID=72036 RepID=A0A0K2T1I6_LEPSM